MELSTPRWRRACSDPAANELTTTLRRCRVRAPSLSSSTHLQTPLSKGKKKDARGTPSRGSPGRRTTDAEPSASFLLVLLCIASVCCMSRQRLGCSISVRSSEGRARIALVASCALCSSRCVRAAAAAVQQPQQATTVVPLLRTAASLSPCRLCTSPHRKHREAAVPARHARADGDPEIPKVDGPAHQEAALLPPRALLAGGGGACRLLLWWCWRWWWWCLWVMLAVLVVFVAFVPLTFQVSPSLAASLPPRCVRPPTT